MSILNEYPATNPTEIYASTNPFLRYAIRVLPDTWGAFLNSYTGLTGFLNNLPTTDWAAAGYLPMANVVQQWIALFFSHRSRLGLYPVESRSIPRKRWNGTAWVADPAPAQGDLRRYAVVETADCSTIGMMGRMYEFLQWFGHDPAVRGECQAWADAFLQVNDGSNVYGHRTGGSWPLYNYVHVGPPAGAVPSAGDDFETKLRWSLEGLPDSWWGPTGHYAIVAVALEKLGDVTGVAGYAQVARQITEGLWDARINKRTFLMPDTVTPAGPLPGDLGDGGRYLHDTDALYWANALYDAYGVTRALAPPIAPLDLGPDGGSLIDRARRRRRAIEAFLTAHTSGRTYPGRYLGLALAVTIDWICGGWIEGWQHFVRKLHLDDGSAGNDTLYGDARNNTLRMLVGAYRYTHDPFYLDLFEAAWAKLIAVASPPGAPPEVTTPLPPLPQGGESPYFFHGLVPSRITAGRLGQARTDAAQDAMLWQVVDAYRASAQAGAPRPTLYRAAQAFALRIIALDPYRSYLWRHYNGLIETSLLRLALASGRLRRIGFDLVSAGVTLTFTGPGIAPLQLTVPGRRAVVYMDDGHYVITATGAGAPLGYTVGADDAHVALPL